MKVYLNTPTVSRGLLRVRDALVRYAPPSIEVVGDEDSADLVIIHVIGRRNQVKERIDRLRAKNKAYAMIQYCLKSTMNPSTKDWIELWNNAKVVWSYYNLPQMTIEDGVRVMPFNPPNFYYAPLGVDSSVFQYRYTPKIYTILASGQHALAEGVRECAFATKRVGGRMFHLGHELRRGEDIECASGMTDYELSIKYSQARYVSGLRRIEGFEQPVIEGALCGARPIVFDRPEMRHWFKEFAIFIQEGTRDAVIGNLEMIFREHARPFDNAEYDLIKERFNWDSIITNFWKQIL